MAKKPKPVDVGQVACPFHTDKTVARVRKSLVTNKLFISCDKCGLIMPTLPSFQEWIKSNAEFKGDFSQMYGDGKQYLGGGEPKAGAVARAFEDKKAGSKTMAKTEPASQKPTDNDDHARSFKQTPVKSNFEQEMGF